ncbi:hypothetical protein B0H10DRAFT_2222421 [Mycena sp. CBHHK59/15]|nr:hypothetical protein B0H10DRAFT_2222421 [Mycena sp. CBHHK59/15]
MTDDSLAATSPTSPEQELAALVAKVAMLSKMSFDMTQLSLDVQAQIPAVIASHIVVAVAEVTSPTLVFVQGVPRTPTQLEAMLPPGFGDTGAWYIVCIGREPGLAEANAQVSGVPNQFCQKKTSHAEALAFYRLKYEHR